MTQSQHEKLCHNYRAACGTILRVICFVSTRTFETMHEMIYGYVRLSNAGAGLEEQISALNEAGAPAGKDVFIDDQQSKGGSKIRTAWRSVTSRLNAGDELVVATLSRIGSSYADAMAGICIVSERGAFLKVSAGKIVISPSVPLCDAIRLAYEAEREGRSEIAHKMRKVRERTGSLGGAPEKLSGRLLSKAEALWLDDKLTAEGIAKKLGLSKRTLYRRLGPRF